VDYLTLRAQAERAGFTLHTLSSGGFVLGRWGLARELPDLAAVAALLLRLGARS